MTLKTSWFNAGIYKNALRRFKWGSFLYFVILFFAVPFMFLVNDFQPYDYYSRLNIRPNMLIENGFPVVPTLTAYAVSVVVAVLLHRYMHENKQSIAVHSMPVTRRSNYISNLLAGFTLMFAPVVANGLILLVMSFTGWGNLFAPVHVMYWIGDNIEVLFFMFSVSTFAAFLTGQWAAHIAITVLLHLLPIITALGVAFFSDVFLYGYTDSQMSAAQILMRNTPFVWMFSGGKMIMGTGWIHLHINDLVYKTVAIALYVGTYFVYKIRKVESCGDVAAFKIVRHVLKYGITAIIMLAISAIGYEAEFELSTIIILDLVFGAIGYFATEMVLSKSLKVFGKYKGFLAFCVATVAFVSFFAFTSVFGYETRVPDAEAVKEASVYDYSECIPYVGDEDFIRHITQIHKEHIEEMPVINPSRYKERSLNISYKLKNGKELVRQYWMNEEEYEAILTSMYENETYKLKAENLYYLNEDVLGGMEMEARLSNQGGVYTYYFNRDDAQRLIKAYKSDLKKMSYEEIQSVTRDVYFSFEIRTRDEKNEHLPDLVTDEGISAYSYVPYSFTYPFNGDFTETMAVLKETGHYEGVMQTIAENLFIGVIPVEIKEPEGEYLSDKEGLYSYKTDVGYIREFSVSLADCEKIDYEDAITYAETLLYKKTTEELAPGKYYAIYRIANYDEAVKTYMSNRINMIGENELPEYLKKYVK